MSSFKKHCEQSVELFGKPYKEVHQWLDEFSEQLGFQHRQKRHHRKGIGKGSRRWSGCSGKRPPWRQNSISFSTSRNGAGRNESVYREMKKILKGCGLAFFWEEGIKISPFFFE